MTDETSARLGLPLLRPGQAQKEVTHNEALTALDLLVQAAVVSAGVDAPPAAPEEGRAWIVGDAPTGAWAGRAGRLAGWTAGGWRFAEPFEGMEVWVADEGVPARYTGGEWTPGDLRATRVLVDGKPVLGPRRPAIASPAGGTTVDASARAAIDAILGAMRAHGLIAP